VPLQRDRSSPANRRGPRLPGRWRRRPRFPTNDDAGRRQPAATGVVAVVIARSSMNTSCVEAAGGGVEGEVAADRSECSPGVGQWVKSAMPS